MKKLALLTLALPVLGLVFACTDAGDPYIPEGGNGGPTTADVTVEVMDMVGDWDNLHVNGELTGDSPVAMTQDGIIWTATITGVEPGTYAYAIVHDDGTKALVEVISGLSVTVTEGGEVTGDQELDLEPAAGTGFNLVVINHNPAYDNIKIKGSYDGWATTERTGMSEDGMYVYRHIEAGLDAGTYEWGVIQDDGSDNGIWLLPGDNLQFDVAADGSVSGTTTFEIPSPQPVTTLTLSCDMNEYGGGSFTTCQVRGSFNGWSDAPTALSDADEDGIWTVELEVEQNQTIDFKFLLDGATYESVPAACGVDDNFGGYNRQVEIATEPVTYSTPWEGCPGD